MLYKNNTPLYHIPYISSGEMLDPVAEKKAAQRIENMLFAGVCGLSCALFEDGDYAVYDNGDDTFCVTILPQSNYSLVGIVNHRLFREDDVVTFDGLLAGRDYLLYAAYQPELDDDPESFRRLASTIALEGNDCVLLARIDLRGDSPVLDEDPEGKLYSKDVLAHTQDNTNPHGRNQIQDELTVNDTLTVGQLEVLGEVYRTETFAGNFQETVIDVGREVVFANIMPHANGQGNVWCVLDGTKVHVYNSGLADGSFTAMIKVR